MSFFAKLGSDSDSDSDSGSESEESILSGDEGGQNNRASKFLRDDGDSDDDDEDDDDEDEDDEDEDDDEDEKPKTGKVGGRSIAKPRTRS